jgi:hypothetical protein
MNKKLLLSSVVLVMAFQNSILGGFWDKVKDAGSAVVGGGSSAIDWTKGTVDSAGHTLIGTAGQAGHYVGEVAADGLTIVSAAGEWVLTEAGKLANAVGCMAKTGVNVSGDIIKSLAGAAISFDEISVEGTLGGDTFAVKARGRIMQQPFNLSSSIGKDGFSQDGFKQLFYEPLAKASPSTFTASNTGGGGGWKGLLKRMRLKATAKDKADKI